MSYVEESVIKKIEIYVKKVSDTIRGRADVGLKKYGVTLARKDLTPKQWIKHLMEELMDATLYSEKLLEYIDEIPKKPVNEYGVECSIPYEYWPQWADCAYVDSYGQLCFSQGKPHFDYDSNSVVRGSFVIWGTYETTDSIEKLIWKKNETN